MHLKELIHQKNLKFTPARENILKIFSNASQPLAYEDIKTQLTMDKATFYRNMITFEKENILKSFESNDKKRYYELTQELHPHFICSLCHDIECLKQTIPFYLKGYTINNIVIHGVCPTCSKIEQQS